MNWIRRRLDWKRLEQQLVMTVTDDERRRKMQYDCVFLLMACISGFMTALNVVTRKGPLTVATFVFMLLCLLDLAMARLLRKNGLTLASCFFIVEILVLFTFFIISGNPEGFSAIWICMLPTCGMLLFGRKNTTILCAIMLVIMVFFFQTPQGVSLLWYDYTASFRMRFPILFSAFYLLSLLLESIREITQRELDKMRLKYEYLYSHDFLTSMLNRHGLMEWEKREKVSSRQAVLMFDIDFFKKVNDSYGHDIGDIVLAGVSAEVAKHVPTSICRWGGEEFVVWFPHGNLRDEEAEQIRAAVEELEIFIPHTEKRVPVTISIGVARAAGEVPLSELIKRADACLYEAKAQGRNRVVFEPKT